MVSTLPSYVALGTIPDELKEVNAQNVTGGLDTLVPDIREGRTEALSTAGPLPQTLEGSGSPSVGLGKGVSEPPADSLKMQSHGPHITPTESETLRPSNLCFNKPARCF